MDDYFQELNRNKKLRQLRKGNKKKFFKKSDNFIRFKPTDYGKKSVKRRMRFNDSLNDKYDE